MILISGNNETQVGIDEDVDNELGEDSDDCLFDDDYDSQEPLYESDELSHLNGINDEEPNNVLPQKPKPVSNNNNESTNKISKQENLEIAPKLKQCFVKLTDVTMTENAKLIRIIQNQMEKSVPRIGNKKGGKKHKKAVEKVDKQNDARNVEAVKDKPVERNEIVEQELSPVLDPNPNVQRNTGTIPDVIVPPNEEMNSQAQMFIANRTNDTEVVWSNKVLVQNRVMNDFEPAIHDTSAIYKKIFTNKFCEKVNLHDDSELMKLSLEGLEDTKRSFTQDQQNKCLLHMDIKGGDKSYILCEAMFGYIHGKFLFFTLVF